MNKSIWHTKKGKPTEDKLVFAQHKFLIRDRGVDWFIWERQEFTDEIREDVIAWCYLDDLLACEQELERTRKALEMAKNAMKSAGTHNSINCIARGEDPSKDDVGITINHALNKITALEQQDVK